MDAYIYQYVIGGLVFFVGMVYAVRQGYVGLSGRGFRNGLVLVAGFAGFMILQGYLQYAPMDTAREVAYDGVFKHKEILGTSLDYGIMVGYFLLILGVGTWFGRGQKSTKDFFFGGQRFSWWLIAFSMVASLVGSYSFVKYSRVAFQYGLSSSQSYLNDWFWMPLFIFGWLPILYFSRVTSIPEYFERRFGRSVRLGATVCILIYLIMYVGVNLYTMGKSLNILLGWGIWPAAILVATVSAIYVTFGGQTSVIMTDLLQGVMLLTVGLLVLVLGICYLGGFETFWHHLPRGHRLAFPNFNTDPSFSGVGIFWQDSMANTAMFYFLNQGIIMRFLAAKSVREAQKVAMFVPIVLMPLAACVVASGGWVGKALVHAGILPPDMKADEAFYVASEFLSKPGIFGLIIAALTAALMSTVDTLITAVSAIAVNDIYKPYIKPEAAESQLLSIARICAISVTLMGVLLVPVFNSFKSIYSAHGAFTASVTPPLVVVLLLSVFWRRFTKTAALATIIGGMAAIIFSLFVPEVIAPFAHGVPMGDAGEGFLSGMRQYKFMRAFYGLSISAVIAVVVTLFTKPEPAERCKGLVWGTLSDALQWGKSLWDGASLTTAVRLSAYEIKRQPDSDLPAVRISRELAESADITIGQRLYLTDRRWWLGGLFSVHVVVGDILEKETTSFVEMGSDSYPKLVRPSRKDCLVSLEQMS